MSDSQNSTPAVFGWQVESSGFSSKMRDFDEFIADLDIQYVFELEWNLAVVLKWVGDLDRKDNAGDSIEDHPNRICTAVESIEVFSKILSQTDIASRLSIPLGCLKHFSFPQGESSIGFDVVDSLQQSWPFTLSVRPQGHAKPSITGSWTSFARAKGARLGDVVSLYKHIHADGEVKYSITVKRKIFNVLANMT
ncbi:unnamed protein product [Dovyalis caffra]|uniref:TF-B3 domain-containing protein n=1 Tax=Dovyalis caffra TaxID=77055 RepID=A0AAV1RK02_9ROSI|nr:unnamed protein product [Dovyalis caffra]